MAYAHTQVNIISRVYLQSDRRYNYTTPKSFLEQISLYSKLLRRKSAELASKIDRLENGLEKLKSTASQVSYSANVDNVWMDCLQLIEYSKYLVPKFRNNYLLILLRNYFILTW